MPIQVRPPSPSGSGAVVEALFATEAQRRLKLAEKRAVDSILIRKRGLNHQTPMEASTSPGGLTKGSRRKGVIGRLQANFRAFVVVERLERDVHFTASGREKSWQAQ